MYVKMALSVQTTLFVKSLSLPFSIKVVFDLVKNENKAVIMLQILSL
jgi:hypothetical protein